MGARKSKFDKSIDDVVASMDRHTFQQTKESREDFRHALRRFGLQIVERTKRELIEEPEDPSQDGNHSGSSG